MPKLGFMGFCNRRQMLCTAVGEALGSMAEGGGRTPRGATSSSHTERQAGPQPAAAATLHNKQGAGTSAWRLPGQNTQKTKLMNANSRSSPVILSPILGEKNSCCVKASRAWINKRAGVQRGRKEPRQLFETSHNTVREEWLYSQAKSFVKSSQRLAQGPRGTPALGWVQSGLGTSLLGHAAGTVGCTGEHTPTPCCRYCWQQHFPSSQLILMYRQTSSCWESGCPHRRAPPSPKALFSRPHRSWLVPAYRYLLCFIISRYPLQQGKAYQELKPDNRTNPNNSSIALFSYGTTQMCPRKNQGV